MIRKFVLLLTLATAGCAGGFQYSLLGGSTAEKMIITNNIGDSRLEVRLGSHVMVSDLKTGEVYGLPVYCFGEDREYVITVVARGLDGRYLGADQRPMSLYCNDYRQRQQGWLVNYVQVPQRSQQ
ncbi:MAG TPA: hypothetical protein VJC12_03205 [Candidatus Paceibacterota bacterium]